MDELRSLLRRYLLGAWRKRWFAIAVCWMVCVAGWVFVSTIPNQYEASARLYVDSDSVLTPLLNGLALDDTPTNQLDVLQRTLLSRPNLEKLISKTDLELSIAGPADLEKLVANLATSIRISPQTRNLFTISYRNSTPKLAYDVVQSILSIFVESKVGANRADMENARVFLQQQISQYERQLREAEARRAEFRTKYIDLLPSDAGISRLDSARAEVRALEGQLKDVLTKRDMMRREMSTMPAVLTLDSDTRPVILPGGFGSSGVDNAQVVQAEAQLAALRLRYTEQHPDVVSARNMVAALKAAAAAAPPQQSPAALAAQQLAAMPKPATRTMPNPVYEQMRMQLFEQETVIASLQRQIAEGTQERDRLEEIAHNVPGLQAEYTNLNRDYDVLHQNYIELLSRRESMRISAAADSDAEKMKMQIIDPPQVPQIPVAPKRAVLLSTVLMAGIGVGLGLAILVLQFDRSFHSIEDLRDLGLPVVGGISMLGVTVPMRRRVLSAASFALAVLLLCAVYGGLVYRLLQTPGAA
jgi:polysaccharide chain length determinant protein (PEP-CTERM system associated)